MPVAKKLTDEKLYLADIQPEMLEYTKKRLMKKKIENIEYYLCNGKTFDLKDNFFDVIYLVAVFGEVENKEAYIKEFDRMLKSNGIISVSELAGDPDKMSIEELKTIFDKYGFCVCTQYGTKRNFTINLNKNKRG